MLKNFLSSVCAGVLISIGGCVFLACENRYVGAVLFSVALLCICLKGYALYTGRVGYIIESHKKSDFAALAVILIGNLITTFLLGMLVRVSMPQLGETQLQFAPASSPKRSGRPLSAHFSAEY